MHRLEAEDSSDREYDGADCEPAPRQENRRHWLVRLGAEDEVRRQSDGGAQRPQHTHCVEAMCARQVEHHRQADQRNRAADNREPAWAPAVTAAAGVQPVASRLAANEPDVANVAPDRRAIARPTLLSDRRTTCLPHACSKDL